MDLEEIRVLIENKLSPKLYMLKNEYYGIQYGETTKKYIKKRLKTPKSSGKRWLKKFIGEKNGQNRLNSKNPLILSGFPEES